MVFAAQSDAKTYKRDRRPVAILRRRVTMAALSRRPANTITVTG
jgi:hypothetical protein